MRKPLTIAAISAALVVTPLALTTPAYAGSALPSLKQLKVSGSWTEPSATQLGNPPGGIPSLCPMGQRCSVRMWADLAGEIPSYALVAAGRATSKAAARALAAQLMQAENVTAARSRILDADFAAETANLTRASILQQAGISVLAQANALPQATLALLQ